MSTVIAAVGTAIKASGLFGAGTGAAATGLSTLSTVLSIGTALASIGQGVSKAKQLRTEAAAADLNAVEETRQGAERARDLSREYADLRSEQQVVQLANGLDIGVGTPVNIARATERQATRNISVTRENAKNRARIQRLRSRGLMSSARGALAGGLIKGAAGGLDAIKLLG